MPRNTHDTRRDQGSILPIVLVVSVVLSVVIVAVANYTATALRYGQASEARAGRLAAAQGAMDDALEQLSIRSSLCATAAGSGSGVNVPFPEPVNGATVSVRCQIVGGELPPIDGWAIVITGEGAPTNTNPTLLFTLGGKPEISGPVYVHNPNRVELQRLTTMVEGDLWYPDDACAVTNHSDTGAQFTRSTMTIPNLSFDPSTRGIYCVNRTWQGLFGTGPAIPSAALAALPPNPPHTLVGSCRVFSPGHYTGELPLGANNYFRSGNYVFENTGMTTLQGRTVTMGQRPIQGFPVIDNTPCDGPRSTDSAEGATLYTRGNTQFDIRANSGFEVSGRRQGNAIVGVQVENTSLTYGNPLMRADNGAQKELAIQGLLWAPFSSFVFDTVPAQKAAVLRGGAIVANFRGGVSAAASGFVIEVPTAAASTKLLLQATATDARGSNTVRVVADYRPSSGEVAVNSRRVVN